MPRHVGRDPESTEEIVANFGRYGPYVKRGDEFRSLSSDAEVFSVNLEEALELFRQEKPSRRGGSRKVLNELGPHPESGEPVRLLEGRYGPYVTDGTTNASLPKDLAADVGDARRGRWTPEGSSRRCAARRRAAEHDAPWRLGRTRHEANRRRRAR